MEPHHKASNTRDSTMEENQSAGINAKAISCLQFTGRCAEALSLYKEVFGTTAMHVYKTPDERYVIHANLTFEDKVIIMAWDDALAIKNSCAQRPGMHFLTMDDIQPTRTKALEKGFKQVASMMCPRSDGPGDMFWGDKCVTLQDPYGHLWVLGQKHEQALDSPEMKSSEKAWLALYDGL